MHEVVRLADFASIFSLLSTMFVFGPVKRADNVVLSGSCFRWCTSIFFYHVTCFVAKNVQPENMLLLSECYAYQQNMHHQKKERKDKSEVHGNTLCGLFWIRMSIIGICAMSCVQLVVLHGKNFNVGHHT